MSPPAPSETNLKVTLVRLLGPGCLAGIRCGDWWNLLAANRFRVDARYWGKALHLSLVSAITSPLACLEQSLYGPRPESTPVGQPLFVLGSWRSGTTHLHNLLCQDERFSAPDLYQTMYPLTYRLSRPWLEKILKFTLPRKRFMDNVEQSFTEPAEDEMALAILCGKSNMLGWAFPRREEYYERYLTFEQATAEERKQFQDALRFFVCKVGQGSGRPLILKSPNHTARIRLLLETFPDARFVHIHRHPYDVYRSFMHMSSQVIPVWALQNYDFSRVEEMVLRLYRTLYESYFAQRELIPPGRLHEVSYERLVQSPRTEVEAIYEALKLPDFAEMRPRLEAYLQRSGSYRTNRHREIPAETRCRLHREWGFCFDAWGYPREDADLNT